MKKQLLTFFVLSLVGSVYDVVCSGASAVIHPAYSQTLERRFSHTRDSSNNGLFTPMERIYNTTMVAGAGAVGGGLMSVVTGANTFKCVVGGAIFPALVEGMYNREAPGTSSRTWKLSVSLIAGALAVNMLIK